MWIVWCLLIIAIFGAGFPVLYRKLRKKHFADDVQLTQNQEIIEAEVATRTKTLEELAQLALGFTSADHFKQLGEHLATVEEDLRSERGRITITEAEIEAVDTRLRELEELRRELEMSNIDAIREVELLKSQEDDLAAQNEALRTELSETRRNVELLKEGLANSPVAQERLSAAMKEFEAVEEKIKMFQGEIAKVNERYVLLKKAYDALDIEYAQLYEKQQAAGR